MSLDKTKLSRRQWLAYKELENFIERGVLSARDIEFIEWAILNTDDFDSVRWFMSIKAGFNGHWPQWRKDGVPMPHLRHELAQKRLVDKLLDF